MASPVEIVAHEPDNKSMESESKKQKLEEFPGDIQFRSSDEIHDNKQDAEDSDSDDDYDLDDYDGDEVLMNQYKLMYRQAYEAEGFHVTAWPSKYIPGATMYTLIEENTPLFYGQVKDCLAYAIVDHNKRVKDDENIELLDIVRAHSTGASIREFYITINARLISTNEHKFYQVLDTWSVEGIYGYDDFDSPVPSLRKFQQYSI